MSNFFKEITQWWCVIPTRRVHLIDSTTYFDREKETWFTTQDGNTFRAKVDELLFRIECNESDIENKREFYVPVNKFFENRKPEFFETRSMVLSENLKTEFQKNFFPSVKIM